MWAVCQEKLWRSSHILLVMLATFLWAIPGTAVGDVVSETAGDPESGRMLALPEGSEDPLPLPLTHTGVQAQVSGLVATVEVVQEFENPHAVPIEAVYVFPLPHDAAVYAMRMKIGERVIQAKIERRGQAEAIYRQAREQGRTAALLNQERPNIFTQSVANILPGDRIRVEITYYQNLVYEGGRFEFVFPMVVGPRYLPGTPTGTAGGGWSPDTDRVPDASRISPPLLPPGVRSGHDIDLCVGLQAGAAIRDLETPSHAIRVDRPGPSHARIRLAARDRIPNKDFILRWRTDQDRPVVGWLAHRQGDQGHFLLLLEPEAELDRTETAPREYVFVVDTSGSMHGFPLDQCKRVMRRCLEDLNPDDTFQVVLFAGSASMLAPRALPATEGNIRRGLAYVNAANGGGGTEFLPALEQALGAPADPDRSRIVLFMSDGYIGYEKEVLRYMREHLDGANLFPMGTGSSVNRYLVDAMARIGGGEPFYVTPNENPDEVVDRFFRYVSRPSLTGVEVDFDGIRVQDLWPSRVPDLFAGRPVALVGRYDRAGRGRVTLSGWLAGKRWERTLEVELPEEEPANAGLALLWARKRIEEISDLAAIGEVPEEEAREDITRLALAHSLMSAYTSFVAVDSQVRNPGGEGQTVHVPVPLPDQVSPLAAPDPGLPAAVRHGCAGHVRPGDERAPGGRAPRRAGP